MAMISKATRSGRLRPTLDARVARTIDIRDATIAGKAHSKERAVRNMMSTFAWRAAWLVAASSAAVSVHAQTAPSFYVTGYRYGDGGLIAGTISPAPIGQ